MLKFLVPLIAAMKVSGQYKPGGYLGAQVAFAWIECRKTLREEKIREQRTKEIRAVTSVD